MVVRSAGDQLHAPVQQALGQGLGVLHHLLPIGFELRLQRLAQAHGLGGDNVHQRAALGAGEDGLVNSLGVLLLAEDHAAPGASQGLVGGSGNHVGVGHRVLMDPRRHQPGDVGHIHHELSPAGAGDLPELSEVDSPGIGAGPGHNELGLHFQGLGHQFVIVNAAGIRVHAVGHKVVQRTGHVHRGAVGQVAALRQVHAQHRVPGLEQGEVHRQVGLGAGVRLHIGVLGAEQLAGPVPGNVLYNIHALAAAVVPFAGVALGVLVGEHRAHGGHHRRGDDVLRGNQLQVPPLAGKLLLHGLAHFRVLACDKADGIHQIVEHGRSTSFLWVLLG